MKHLILVFIIMGTVLVFWGCQEDSALAPVANQSDQGSDFLALAKKPAPNLTGTMELDFTFGVWPEEPVWVGTISFEGYDDYGIRFYHLSDFRDYSQASPFEEYFQIYDLVNGTVYLGGPDVGVTTLANKPPEPTKYRMNGEITEATGDFEMWMGRNVHMSGVITWQGSAPPYAPFQAPGTFRIN